jgi:hypothetical protein
MELDAAGHNHSQPLISSICEYSRQMPAPSEGALPPSDLPGRRWTAFFSEPPTLS